MGFNVCAYVLQHHIGEDRFYTALSKIFTNHTLEQISKMGIGEVCADLLIDDKNLFTVLNINGNDYIPIINDAIKSGDLVINGTIDNNILIDEIYQDDVVKPIFDEDITYLLRFMPEYIVIDDNNVTIQQILDFSKLYKKIFKLEQVHLYKSCTSYSQFLYKNELRFEMERRSPYDDRWFNRILSYDGDDNEVLKEINESHQNNLPVKVITNKHTTVIYVHNSLLLRWKLINDERQKIKHFDGVFHEEIDDYHRFVVLSTAIRSTDGNFNNIIKKFDEYE